jgi:tetratricopeptide (TPR) repeat protein
MVTSYNNEGYGWGKAALERVKILTDNGKILTSDENLHRARLLVAMSILSITIGDSQASAMEAEQATTLLRSLGDKWTLAIALAFHTGVKLTTGKFNEAIASIDEALRLAEELGDRYVLGTVMSAASFVEFFVNRDFAKADTFREKASELLREHGSRYSYGLTVLGFGDLLVRQGQFQKAREELNSAMQTMQEIGSTRHIANIKSVLAHVLRREGNYIEAIPAYQETIKEWKRMGQRSAVAHQLECLAFIAKAMEQPDQAARLLGAAEGLRQKIEIDMTPSEREEYEKEVADLKANMDEKVFDSLWKEGRSMTMDEAIDLALN